MSLHTLAKHVQQKGRGKDQMLVHMSPREVQGLQALAKASGGSLTINPETGLPEAGFLEQVLPIVAMAAATYFTAGAAAPALSAALAAEGMAAGTAATVGGAMAGAGAGAGVGALGAAVQGKDVGKGALMGGLGGAISGGMGAYGGAGDVAGETAKVSQVTDAVNQGAQAQDAIKQATMDPNAGIAGTTPGMPTSPTGMPTQVGGPGMPQAPTPSIPADQVANLPYSGQGPTNTLPEGYKVNEFGDAYKAPPQQQNFFERLINKPSVPTPELEENKSYYSTMGTPGKLMTQALPGMTADMGMNTPKGPPGPEAYRSMATLSPDFKGYTPEPPDPRYKAQYTRYAADGGLMALAGGGMPEDIKKKKQRASLTSDRTMAAMNADQAGLAMLNNARYGANMTGAPPMSSMTLGDLPNPVGAAGGGLADLGGYSDGGRLLKGPGDGMSDNIPAQIGRKQPARLADGEFVVPADVVSHLGNGSTDAGAKRLYSMMDKVRQARTGKKKQAPAVNTNRYLPV